MNNFHLILQCISASECHGLHDLVFHSTEQSVESTSSVQSWAKSWWQLSAQCTFSTLPCYKQWKLFTVSRQTFRVRSNTWQQFLTLVLLKYKPYLTPLLTHPCAPSTKEHCWHLRTEGQSPPLVHRPRFFRYSFSGCLQILSVTWQKLYKVPVQWRIYPLQYNQGRWTSNYKRFL